MLVSSGLDMGSAKVNAKYNGANPGYKANAS